jgi:hypothetical protein
MTAKPKLEHWPLDRPTPYPGNARVCPEAAIAKVAASIAEYGFRSPLLVDAEGVIIAGHTRLLAARRLQLATVPVIVCADLPPEKVRALRLADNRTAQETTWDDDLLAVEFGELLELDVDLSLAGFEEAEWTGLPAEGGAPGSLDAGFESGDGIDYEPQYGVIVTCASEAEQQQVYERLHGEGYACRVVTV